MDDLSRAVQGISEVVKATPSWLNALLDTLDRYNFLPMGDYRKKNLLDKAHIECQLDEQKKSHFRAMELADAQTRAKIALMERAPQLALEAASKRIEEGISVEQAFQECLPLAVRATSNLYKETLESEYSRERIALYALNDAADCPNTATSEGETSETWFSRFWNYAKEVRDEDAMSQWGKLLAGEVRNPGSFSLRTLSVLRTMDSQTAKRFNTIAKYAVKSIIPIFSLYRDDLNKIGTSTFELSNLESYGLVVTDKTYELKPDKAHLLNQFFCIDCGIIKKTISIEMIGLTEVGMEILKISNISREDFFIGSNYIIGVLKDKYKLKPILRCRGCCCEIKDGKCHPENIESRKMLEKVAPQSGTPL